MALGVISDPNALSQGGSDAVADMVFGTPTGMNVTITSAGAGLPDLIAGEFFEIRDHSQTVNNGLYIATGTPTTSSLPSTKVSGSAPVVAGSEAATVLASVRNAETVAFVNASGSLVDMTGTGLPALVVGSRFVIEDHSTGGNNGPYEVVLVNGSTTDYSCRKLTGTDPVNAAGEPLTMITDVKSVMFDVAALEIYLLEQPSAIAALDLDGVLGQPLYSFAVISWKDDNFLFANAGFPMLCIDADAGKYVVGQDPAGNNNGWTFRDNGTHSIRTRKLVRNMGWSEIASDGNLDYIYAGLRTLGAFLDETPSTGDTAYYQFGTDTTVNDTVDFTFAGPVNEAVQVYNGLATAAAGSYAISTNNTITRGAGSWITEGYKVGGQITILDAEDVGNVGTFVIESLTATVLVVEGTPLTNNADDDTMYAAVDNRNAITLRLRERTTPGNSNARTFAQSNLAAAGETVLSNRLFTFGLSNSQDLDISASDATIDGSAPYTGMSITYYATPQSLGGGGVLVGGPYDFGIVIDGNNGTNTQVYEWVQRQLRKTTDIDADADTAIGVTMDGLMRFVGPTLQVGSVDGGLTFPRNPDGGGSGVFITDLNAASSNDTVYYDNTGGVRSAPLTVAVTLDFNQTIIDDSVAEFTLFFDRTIRTTVSDLVIAAGTGANGTFTSAGSNLPASLNRGVGAYVRISGLTGGDAAMNGVYQVTGSIDAASYDVTRYDGQTIVTTGSASLFLDQNCIDTPDAIIVQDSLSADVTGLATSDYSFNFDYSNNVQGGRTASTDAFVQARAIEQADAQYTQSTVQTISTTAVTIPLSAAIERNFNP
jgi:hypothetical protein